MLKNHFVSRIYIAGHRGMVGAALVRALERAGYTNLITRTHAERDLTDQAAVETFFAEQRPTQVYLAAAMSAASTPTTPTQPNSPTRIS